MIRVLCILGMRPEAIGVAPLVQELRKFDAFVRARKVSRRSAPALAAIARFGEEVVFWEHAVHCQDLSAPE